MEDIMEKKWQEYSNVIKEVLGLTGSPVALTYSMEALAGADTSKCRICNAFLKARDGKTIDISASNSTCIGGTTHLGLARPTDKDADKALKEFLVHGEKLYSSVAAFYRSQRLTAQPPFGLAEHIILSPLEKAELCPDLVLFICNAEQACRIVTLDGYETGIPPRLEMSGSTCSQVVSYPIVSGELNVSLMDYTSRRMEGYKKDEVFVSVPYHRFVGIMRSIDGCSAGRAKFEVPESFRRFMGDGHSK
jgi:uncharacterized protein (DUF169 family)